MIRITPAIRLSLGLIILVISILILAQALGLTPDSEKQQFEMRKHFAETLAAQVTLTIERGDLKLLRDLLDTSLETNPDLRSAAVRKTDTTILAQTSKHPEAWVGAEPQKSTPTHIRFPILMSGIKRAEFEVSFAPLAGTKHPFFRISTFAVLIIFVSLTGFFGFWLYIKRVLKHLDPSSVVPARVRNALNVLAEGVLILDRREQIVLANTAFLQQTGKTESGVLGKKASTLNWELGDHQEIKIYPWLNALETGNKLTGVRLYFEKNTEQQKVFSVNAVPILDPNGKSQGVIAVFDDISELEQKSLMLEDMIRKLAHTQITIENKNKELTYLATRDPLTNCFNRRALYEYLESKFGGERRSDAEFCCIIADIDFFKKVNDTYGHNVGDEVIKMAAASLRESVRELDIVARMGGEEFCVVLPGASITVAHEIAERCRNKIAAQITQGVKVTSSFGVTSNLMGAKTPAELIHQADEALYYSKQHGRNQVTTWNNSIESTKIA